MDHNKEHNEDHNTEHNKEHIVHSTSEVVFLHLSEFPHLLALFADLLLLEAGFLLLPEEVSVTHKSAEDKEDADQHPGGDGSHALHVGRVGGDHVEDVCEHKEEGDEHRHPAGDNIRGNEETYPGDYDKEAGGEIVDDEVL